MTDTAEPIAKPYRLHMVAAVALGGLLWLADGRLWPSVWERFDGLRGDVFWIVILLQWVVGPWLTRYRLGRIVAVFLYGALSWFVAEVLATGIAEGGQRRSIVLVAGALVLALIAANVVWDRLPEAWRARLAASRISYRIGSWVLLVLGGAFIWLTIGATAEGVSVGARVGLTALFLAMSAGLILALWRLEGGIRTLVCWAICGLTWAGIMTGIAGGASPAGIGLGSWLLALLPPVIVGAVLLAYHRINRTYGV